jgi:hypothetical protein
MRGRTRHTVCESSLPREAATPGERKERRCRWPSGGSSTSVARPTPNRTQCRRLPMTAVACLLRFALVRRMRLSGQASGLTLRSETEHPVWRVIVASLRPRPRLSGSVIGVRPLVLRREAATEHSFWSVRRLAARTPRLYMPRDWRLNGSLYLRRPCRVLSWARLRLTSAGVRGFVKQAAMR